MNSDNFNNNPNQNNSGNSVGRTSSVSQPQKLSAFSKVAFCFLSTFLAILCGFANMLGISSANEALLLFTATLSLLIYVVVGGFSALLALNSPFVAPIPPILTFVVMFLLGMVGGGNSDLAFVVPLALSSLFPFVCGSAIAVAMRLGAKRTGAIVCGAVCGAVLCFGVLYLAAFLSGNSISGSEILEFVDDARAKMISELEVKLPEVVKLYDIDIGDIDVESMVNGSINVMPAMIALVFTLEAFFSHLSLLALCRICNLYHKLEKKDTEFKVSAVCAVVYAVSYVMLIFMNAGGSVAQAAAENLSIILMPVLALVGFMSFLPRKEGNVIRVGCFSLTLMIGLLLFATGIAILILSFVGVWVTLRNGHRETKNNKNKI